jgi:hypothetical protein
MRLLPYLAGAVCLSMVSCAAGSSPAFLLADAPPELVTEPTPLTWDQAMNLLRRGGFDEVNSAFAYGPDCWQADAFVTGRRTTLYIDPEGRVFEEFAPPSCRSDTGHPAADGRRSALN